MAIPFDPSREEIYAEFGTNTAPANTLLDMWNKANFSTGNYSRDQFGAKGQPEQLDNQTPTNVTSDGVTFVGTVNDINGMDTRVYWQYDTDSNFGSFDSSGTDLITVSGESATATVTGLASSTKYYCRIVAYNNFNDASGDHKINTSDVLSFTTNTACADPTNFSAIYDGFQYVDLNWDSTYDPANGWEIQWSEDGSLWNLAVDNLAGSNRSYSHDICAVFSGTSTIYYRIKAQCSGSESNWVNTSTSVDCK